MPTPKERNALIFLAALGAIGIGVRAFRGPPSAGGAPTVASRAALDRQIGAVDSAKSASRTAPAKRSRGRRASKPGDTADTADTAETAGPSVMHTAPRRQTTGRASARRAPPQTDSAAPDPLAMYEARRLRVERLNKAVQARIDRERAAAPMDPGTSVQRRSGTHKKLVKIQPVPGPAIRP